MERVFPTQRRLNQAASPGARPGHDLPVAGDEVFGAVRRFYDRLDGVRELLTDAERTSVRLVVNPERMVVAEARRTYTYLSLFGYHVDAVIANRLLPDAITDPWFDAWKAAARRAPRRDRGGVRPAAGAAGPLARTSSSAWRPSWLRAGSTASDPAIVLHEGEPLQVVTETATS